MTPRACITDGSDCGHSGCPVAVPEITCDRCGKPIVGEGRGHDTIEFINLHVAAGNQSTRYTAEGEEEVDWDPESEYDFCDDCAITYHAAFEAFMAAGKGRRTA